jgi:hypothetical protein
VCEQFVDFLNNLMPGVIKLKANYADESIEFLDLKIMIIDGRLETDLYIRPTNLQLYLDFASNHPFHCKSGLVYGQALRIIERCSRAESVEAHLENLKAKLVERNYPIGLIGEQFSKAKKKDRKELIFQQRKNGLVTKKTRLFFTHNEGNLPFHEWIRESTKFLNTPKAKKIGEGIQVSFKQPKNIKQLLTGSKKPRSEPCEPIPGCFKCSKGCKVSCRVMKQTKYCKSTNTPKSYKIQHCLDCTGSFGIYLATCQRCGGQYLGKSTKAFKLRHSNHKEEIEKGREGVALETILVFRGLAAIRMSNLF